MSLGAWCDMRTVDEQLAELASAGGASDAPKAPLQPGWSVVTSMTPQEVEMYQRDAHFRVEEFATLSDGRRVTLSQDRGWSSSGVSGAADDDLWAYLAVEDVERDVLNVVLPDDAEATGDKHPWELFAERLVDLGVSTTPEDLRALPYEVILSQRLRERLPAPTSAAD